MLGRIVDVTFKSHPSQPHVVFKVLREDGVPIWFSERVSQELNDPTHKHRVYTPPLKNAGDDDTLVSLVHRLKAENKDIAFQIVRGYSEYKSVIHALLGNPTKEKDKLPLEFEYDGEVHRGFIYTPSKPAVVRSRNFKDRVKAKKFLGLMSRTFPNASFEIVNHRGIRIKGINLSEKDVEKLAEKFSRDFMINSVLSVSSYNDKENAKEVCETLKNSHYYGDVSFRVVPRIRNDKTKYYVEALATKKAFYSLKKDFDLDNVGVGYKSNTNDPTGLFNPSIQKRAFFPAGLQVDLDKPMYEQANTKEFPFRYETIDEVVDDLETSPAATEDVEVRDFVKGSSLHLGEMTAAVIRTNYGFKVMPVLKEDPEFDEVEGYKLEGIPFELLIKARIQEINKWLFAIAGHYMRKFDRVHMGDGVGTPSNPKELEHVLEHNDLTEEERTQLELDVGRRMTEREILKAKKIKIPKIKRGDVEVLDSLFYYRARGAFTNGIGIEGVFDEEFKPEIHDDLQLLFESDDPEKNLRFYFYTSEDGTKEFQVHFRDINDTEERPPSMFRKIIEEGLLFGVKWSHVSAYKPKILIEADRRRRHFLRTGVPYGYWRMSKQELDSELQEMVTPQEIMSQWFPKPTHKEGNGIYTGVEVSLPTLFLDAAMPLIEGNPVLHYMYDQFIEIEDPKSKIIYWNVLHGYLTSFWHDVKTFMDERHFSTDNDDVAFGKTVAPAQLYRGLPQHSISDAVNKEIETDLKNDYFFRQKHGTDGCFSEDSSLVEIEKCTVNVPTTRMTFNNILASHIPPYAGLPFHKYFLFGNALPGEVIIHEANVLHARKNGSLKTVIYLPEHDQFLYAGFLGAGRIKGEVRKAVREALRTGEPVSVDDIWNKEEMKNESYIADALSLVQSERQLRLPRK